MLLAACACAAGCSGRPDGPPAPPRFAGARADVAVVEAPRTGGGNRKAERERLAIAGGWVNFASGAVGPFRVVGSDFPADSLRAFRIVVVPPGAAGDAGLAEACRAFVDSGGVVLVDARGTKEDRTRRLWEPRPAGAAPPGGEAAAGRILVVEGASGGELDKASGNRALASAAASGPLPTLGASPSGHSSGVCAAFAGDGPAAAGAAEAAARRNLVITAFVAGSRTDVADLEAIRRSGCALGVVIEPEAGGAPWRGNAGEHWQRIRNDIEALRKKGATAQESAMAYSQGPLPPAALARLAGAGIRHLAVPSNDPASLPAQALDEHGNWIELVVYPVRALPAWPDTSWAQTLDAERAAGAWVTRLDAYARFWEARARTSLQSRWDGTRLFVDAHLLFDGAVLLVPVAGGGKVLSQMLSGGKEISGDAVEGPAGPSIRLPLHRGRNVLWALYS